jgi:hypothetical protein
MNLIFVFLTKKVENRLQWNKFILFLLYCMENHHLKCTENSKIQEPIENIRQILCFISSQL